MTDPSEKSLCNGVNIERKDYMVLLEEGCEEWLEQESVGGGGGMGTMGCMQQR